MKASGLAQTGPIIAAAARAILEQMSLIDPRREQRIALQVQHLPVTVGRDPHVPNQHVRKTSSSGFPYTAPFRQGLSCGF
jgi:hypothetical protein